jgi:hypothetical protein
MASQITGAIGKIAVISLNGTTDNLGKAWGLGFADQIRSCHGGPGLVCTARGPSCSL